MRLMTIPELAIRIGVTESRARFLVSSGRIRGQQVGGRCVIYEADAADGILVVPRFEAGT